MLDLISYKYYMFKIACCGICMRAAIMAQGQNPRAIIAARRPIPRPYHYEQPLNYLLALLLILTPGHYGFY